jgi:hypothetical protein
MKVLNDLEAIDWCRRGPLHFGFDDEGLLCSPTGGQTYRVDISKMPWRDLLPTATSLAFLGSRSVEGFFGGLVWVRRTGIASPDWEVVILRALERFRLGFGENRSLEAARAHFFRSDESSECSAVLLLVLLAEWDAYFIHSSGDWIAFISHDDHITVVTKTPEVGRDIKESLETWGAVVQRFVPPRLF